MLRPASLLAALLLIGSRLFGQQDVRQQPSQSNLKVATAVPDSRAVLPPQDLAKLSARTDLVLVPVIVTDKGGKHLSGLTKEAFRVEESGMTRSVSFFEETKTEKLVARGKDAAVEQARHSYDFSTLLEHSIIGTPR